MSQRSIPLDERIAREERIRFERLSLECSLGGDPAAYGRAVHRIEQLLQGKAVPELPPLGPWKPGSDWPH